MTDRQRIENDKITTDKREIADKTMSDNRIRNDDLTRERRLKADKTMYEHRLKNDQLTNTRREINDGNRGMNFALFLLFCIILGILVYFIFI